MKTSIFKLSVLASFFFALNVQAQNWVWMHGTDSINSLPMYGPSATYSTTNRPGSLEGAAYWTDLNGNFWMFGGSTLTGTNTNSQFVNDLWRFDVGLNAWQRVRGSGTMNTAVYGTLNVVASTNSPGGRRNAAAWTDNSGNLWLFGGEGVTTSTLQGKLNDLWKYSISNDMWTWVGGSNFLNQSGTYGTQGVPSAVNIPGARSNSGTWISGSNLYLFGGDGYSATSPGYLGDLWRYDMLSGQWVWLKGSAAPFVSANHGTQNMAALSNNPGSRSSACAWKDNSGNLWLGGGFGSYSGFGNCSWGDLWMYSPSSNNWTWVKGANVPFTSPAYGTLAVASATADPGSRTGSCAWTDSNGDFWLFGGETYLSANTGDNSDLWKYTVSTGNWTWMKGPNAYNQPGYYGTKNFPMAQNNPPYRKNISGAWKDNAGNLWMHGGSTLNASLTPSVRVFADLWKLNTCTVVPAAPSVIAVNTNSACAGAVISFSTVSSSPYVFWQNVATGSVIGTGSVYSSTFATGAYSIAALSANACSVSAGNPVTTMTLYTSPTVSVNNGVLCSGRIFTMTPAGAATYSFSSGSNTVSPVNTSTYQVTGSNAQGCPSTNTAICTVSVIPQPTVTVNSGSLCPGLTFSMFPTGAQSYSFSSGSSIVMNVQTTNTYMVVGGFPNGCRDTAIAQVVVYPLPTVAVQGGSICSGQSFTLVPSGAASYTFSSGTSVVSPTVTKNYTVTGTSSVGCVSSSGGVGTVTVFANPNILILAPSTTVCNGQLTNYTVTGASYYSWNAGITGSVLPITFAIGTTTLYVAGIDNNGCANTSSLALWVTNCNGLKETIGERQFSVFPNPSQGQFWLNTELPAVLRVYNSQGKILLENTVEAGSAEIDLQKMPAGVYFLECQTARGQERIKLVKTE